MAIHRAQFATSARAAVLLGALFAAFSAAAQIYTWTDKDGRTHYADTPPKTVDVKVIGPVRRPPPPPQAEPEEGGAATDAAQGAAQPQSPPTLADRELEFRKRRAEEAEAQAKAEADAKREEERQRACSQARAQLAALQGGQRVARFNEDGSREFLDDAAREQQAAQIQAFLDRECQ
jgi:type IV secretory pathway VirB10-like protein